ncbi:hypothetical protein QTO34_017664 [Cnephaeus nilssonii]|uniref:Uncharacterized protein n=1 Tax=Cnephaeus nilssonii TaxID=3371016 RepID=A0AA40I1I3_CNENI|nr:hypothetical protein QTO34_017664 [Eptesicus nilssonii]
MWGVQAALHRAPPPRPCPLRCKSPPTRTCCARSLLMGRYCDGILTNLHITLLLLKMIKLSEEDLSKAKTGSKPLVPVSQVVNAKGKPKPDRSSSLKAEGGEEAAEEKSEASRA